MKHLFAGVALALLLAGCIMPNAENPNSLRARMLGISQPAQAAQVQPTNPPQPTATAQPMQPAHMAGALADAPMVDANGADPYEVAQALALAIGGVIGFYLFATWIHGLVGGKLPVQPTKPKVKAGSKPRQYVEAIPANQHGGAAHD